MVRRLQAVHEAGFIHCDAAWPVGALSFNGAFRIMDLAASGATWSPSSCCDSHAYTSLQL